MKVTGTARPAPTTRLCALAWLFLVYADILFHANSFESLLKLVARARVRQRVGYPVETVCEAMIRAKGFYFRRAWCLQTAIATALLVKRYGRQATIVIGVRRSPFFAHAWVETEGSVVINHHPRMETFLEVFRC